jgi:hypothetical protein
MGGNDFGFADVLQGHEVGTDDPWINDLDLGDFRCLAGAFIRRPLGRRQSPRSCSRSGTAREAAYVGRSRMTTEGGRVIKMMAMRERRWWVTAARSAASLGSLRREGRVADHDVLSKMAAAISAKQP